MKNTCYYKYLQQDYAKGVMENGLFRIGTLFEYRDTNLYGVEIGDALEGRLVSHEEEETDCYLYSLSELFDPHAMQRMGFDTCLRIMDPHLFLNALSNAFLQQGILVNPARFGRCIYLEQGDPCVASDALHPFFLKHSRYSYQKEVRAIWKPKHLEIQPLILSAPQAVRFCDFHLVRNTLDILVNI